MKGKQLTLRWLIYAAGMLIQGLGLYLNARCGLGTSALLGVAFVLGEAVHITFGDASKIIFALYILAQFIVRGRRHRQWRDILQLPVAIFIGEVFNLLDLVIPRELLQANLAVRLLVLACAVVFNGIGATLAVNMRLIPSPGDGIVQALADRSGMELGKMKRIMDCSMVVIAALLSFAIFGRLLGVGLGTIVAMFAVGKIISICNRMFGDTIRTAAGMDR